MDAPLYHWGGKTLLLDTVVRRKRFVAFPGAPIQFCPFDVRRWVHPPEDELLGRAWQELSQRWRIIPATRRFDAVARVAWHYVVEHVPYQPESEDFDFWQFPPETLVLGHGDCEDKAFLCASLLLAAGVPEDRVRVVLGGVLEANKRDWTGHAWPAYQTDAGWWAILEPNLPHLPDRNATTPRGDLIVPNRDVGPWNAVFLPADWHAHDHAGQQYVPLICFHHRAVWTVEETVPGTVHAGRRLAPDWSRNPTFEEILAVEERIITT